METSLPELKSSIRKVDETNSGFAIIACNTPDELAVKVSSSLKDGKMFLHGQPFVFKDQICQALKFISYG